MQLAITMAESVEVGDIIIDGYNATNPGGRGSMRIVPKGRLITVTAVTDDDVREDFLILDGWFSLGGKQRLPWTLRIRRTHTVHLMLPVDETGFIRTEDPAIAES